MGAATTQHTPPYLKNSTPHQKLSLIKRRRPRPSLTEGFSNRFFFQILFFTCLHVFYTRCRTEWDSLFSEWLRSYSERYPDLFFFSPGARFDFLRCCHLRRKKQNTGFDAFSVLDKCVLEAIFQATHRCSSENGASHELYRNWVSPRRAQPPFLLSILQCSPNYPRRFAHNARLLPRTKAAVPVPDTPHLRADTPGLTSTRHVCVLEPSQGTVLTIVVVPSMLRFVTFKRNVCTSETDG